MKKLLTLLPALALCFALAAPVSAAASTPGANTNSNTNSTGSTASNANANAVTGTFGPLTVVDGSSAITFGEARLEDHTILLAHQFWYKGAAAAVTTVTERTDIKVIVVKPGSTVTRSASATPLTLSYVTRNGGEYLVCADQLTVYPASFGVDRLLAYPFATAEMCVMTLADGTEYLILSGAARITEAPAVPISYVVKSGETLDYIALNYYGADKLGEYLQKENPEHFNATNGILEAGRELILPVTLNGHPRLAEPLAQGNELIYVIKSGDTLASISQKFYGRSDFSTYIYQRNADRIKNPGLITVGQVIVLPVVAV
ncbi:MAG: LysM peptidoglycan-binding domain-containing protein [Oscillospiraceae bacterium]|nr:LysM peptidoglycan-binding domain-containing protein [Oscillospiraceae bacterium]